MKITQAMFEQGYRLIAGHIRAPLIEARPAVVGFHFRGDPPTATHHAKKLGIRDGKLSIRNKPELDAAHAYYARQLPARVEMMPLRPPILADVTFFFPIPTNNLEAQVGAPCPAKPDRDNAVKVLFDELALAGYIAEDCQISDGPIRKRWGLRAQPPWVGVVVLLRSIDWPGDDLKFTSSEMADAMASPGILLKCDPHGPAKPPAAAVSLSAVAAMKPERSIPGSSPQNPKTRQNRSQERGGAL